MPAPKPISVPDWATTATGIANSTTPSAGFRGDGWPNGYQPPSQYFNYWQNLVGQWCDWLNDLQNEVLLWTALNTFSAGIAVTQSVLNGSAVIGTGNGSGAGVYGVSGDTNNASGVLGFVGAGATNGRGGQFTGKGTGEGATHLGGTNGPGSINTAGGGNNSGAVNTGTGSSPGALNLGGDTGAGSDNAAGAGSNTYGARGLGDGTGVGLLGVGGSSSAGVQATAGAGGIRGALRLSVQATPSAPLNGDAWVDNSGSRPRAGVADFNGATRYFVGHDVPTGLTYDNSWTDHSTAPAGFYTSGQGRCYLRGSIRNAGTPTLPQQVAHSLPVPSALTAAGFLQLAASVNGGSYVFLRISNTGTLTLADPGGNWASGNSVDLEGLSYDVQT